jgi:hypothetical protein
LCRSTKSASHEAGENYENIKDDNQPIRLRFFPGSRAIFFCQATTSKKSIAEADIVGDWGFGSSLMMTYLDHGTGNYSHSGNIFGMKYVIKSDGTFVYKFAARYGSKTIREWGSGTVLLSRDFITFKFEEGPAEKYKFVALETNADGASVLTLIQVVETSRHLKCGHSNGYFDCAGRQEWTLRKPGT